LDISCFKDQNLIAYHIKHLRANDRNEDKIKVNALKFYVWNLMVSKFEMKFKSKTTNDIKYFCCYF
jgi:hypothetical protein